MRILRKISLLLAVSVISAISVLPIKTAEAVRHVTTPGTGYTKAEDVVYKTFESGDYIANWGSRGENATFLSKYAKTFYTGSYTYDALVDSSSSSLYSSLHSLMSSKHTHRTTYDETKDQYKYTDCEKNNTSYVYSFYSGERLSGSWGGSWNREHTWPRSKCVDTSKKNDSADIMMLRPTLEKENSARGNYAYGGSTTSGEHGKSGSYYYPGDSVKGDCARIVLYAYVRWENKNLFGSNNVMQDLDTLLEWMEDDPVDTWEMGRNDAVQAITGTRNVFVDYPEYAWLLFGEDVPDDLVTPSGNAENGNVGGGSSSSGNGSSSNDNSSSSSGNNSSSSGNSSSSNENSSSSNNNGSSGDMNSSEVGNNCEHKFGKWFVIVPPTSEEYGSEERFCELCGEKQTSVIGKLTDKEQPGESFGCVSAVGGVGAGLTAIFGGCALAIKKKRKR